MNNQVGRPKKAAKRTQLKFRYASLKPVERLKATQLRRYAFILLQTYALLSQVPATMQLLVNAVHIIQTRRRLLTNYCPLVHLRLEGRTFPCSYFLVTIISLLLLMFM